MLKLEKCLRMCRESDLQRDEKGRAEDDTVFAGKGYMARSCMANNLPGTLVKASTADRLVMATGKPGPILVEMGFA